MSVISANGCQEEEGLGDPRGGRQWKWGGGCRGLESRKPPGPGKQPASLQKEEKLGVLGIAIALAGERWSERARGDEIEIQTVQSFRKKIVEGAVNAQPCACLNNTSKMLLVSSA